MKGQMPSVRPPRQTLAIFRPRPRPRPRCLGDARLQRLALGSVWPAALLLAALAVAPAAQASEPPLVPNLSCQVLRHATGLPPALSSGATIADKNRVGTLSPGASLQLWLSFENHGETPIQLPPGPHLVYYDDAQASEAMLITARLERLPNTPINVPAHGQVQALLALSGPRLAEFRCNGRLPSAAGLNFYHFSQWPQRRCLLTGYALDALPMDPDCPGGRPSAPLAP